MNKRLNSWLVAAACMAPFSPAAIAAPDWNNVPKTDIFLFHPGATPFEWLTDKGGKHGGVKGLKKNMTCTNCHIEEGKLNLNLQRLASKDGLEPLGAPAVMSFQVAVQAAFDESNLYMRLTFKPPVGSFHKADKVNEVKATVMFANEKVEKGKLFGCWAGCHLDAQTMSVSQGAFDLMQWRSGEGGKATGGIVADKTSTDDGKFGVTAEASKAGDTYTVTFTRKLAGGVEMVPGKSTPIGISIHADHSGGRFHHVSLEHRLGIGIAGDVSAVKQ